MSAPGRSIMIDPEQLIHRRQQQNALRAQRRENPFQAMQESEPTALTITVASNTLADLQPLRKVGRTPPGLKTEPFQVPEPFSLPPATELLDHADSPLKCSGYEFSTPATPTVRRHSLTTSQPVVIVTPPQPASQISLPGFQAVGLELPGFQSLVQVGNLPTMPDPLPGMCGSLPRLRIVGTLPGFKMPPGFLPVVTRYRPARIKASESEDAYSLTRPVQIRRRSRNGGINPRMPRPQHRTQTPTGVLGIDSMLVPMSKMPDHKVLVHLARDLRRSG